MAFPGKPSSSIAFSPLLVPAVFSSDLRELGGCDDPYDDPTSSSDSSSHALNLAIELPERRRRRGIGTSNGVTTSPRGSAGTIIPLASDGAQHFYKHQPFLSGFACGLIACTLLGLLPVLALVGMVAKDEKNLKTSEGRGSEPRGGIVDPWSRYTVKAPAGLGVVATDNAICSEVGVSLLQRGGNAVDAAVGAALCLGVLSPGSSGLGGGCYAVFYNVSTHSTRFIDARESAPAAATADMFEGNPLATQDGGLAIATLAEVQGLYKLWQEGGSGQLDWKELTVPATGLARSWQVSREVAAHIQSISSQLLSLQYPALSRLYLRPNGELKVEGDFVQNQALAHTLEQLGDRGPSYLYEDMADVLAQEVRDAGGRLTADDLRTYSAKEEAPIITDILGHTIVTAGGSSSGGAAVAAIVKYLGGHPEPLASLGDDLYAHRLVEGMKHAFAIRLSLGDPAFVNTTQALAALTSAAYLAGLRDKTSDEGVLPIDKYGGAFNLDRPGAGAAREDHGTSHLSVLDKWGNAVALTSTVNTVFGSKVVSPSTGILFNNQMDDFSIPGSPNYYGLAPSPFNYPAPLKRPLSSMSPCIVFANRGRGKETVRLVGGASGGPRIISATAQVLLNVLGRGMGLVEALRAPRLHSQLLPNTVYVEEQSLVGTGSAIDVAESLTQSLRARGHNTTACGTAGAAQFISVDPDDGSLWACSDPRKGGAPAREQGQ